MQLPSAGETKAAGGSEERASIFPRCTLAVVHDGNRNAELKKSILH